MKKILVPLSMLIVALLTFTPLSGQLMTIRAWFNEASVVEVTMEAASLNLKLDGEDEDTLVLNLGEIRPGDDGVLTLSAANTGTIPGVLCMAYDKRPPAMLVVRSDNLCDRKIKPKSEANLALEWVLPLSTRGTGLDGKAVEYSYSLVFENGYKIAKRVVVKGIIRDPNSAPTQTQVLTPTNSPTPVIVREVRNTPLVGIVGTLIAQPTNVITPVAVPTQTQGPPPPTRVIEISTPSPTPTPVPPTSTVQPTDQVEPTEPVPSTPTVEPTTPPATLPPPTSTPTTEPATPTASSTPVPPTPTADPEPTSTLEPSPTLPPEGGP